MYGGPLDGNITKRREKIMNDAYDQTVSETIELINSETTPLPLKFDTIRLKVILQIREIISSKSSENEKVAMVEGVMKAYTDVWDKTMSVALRSKS